MANEFRATLQDFVKTIDRNGEFGWLINSFETMAEFSNPQLTGEQFFKICLVFTEAKDDEVAEHKRS